MTTSHVFSTVLLGLVVGGSVALIVLAGVILARSRRADTVRLFGRRVYYPRLWASAAVCGGAAGLFSEAREFLPHGWQEATRNIHAALQLVFFALLFTHILRQWSAQRRQHRATDRA